MELHKRPNRTVKEEDYAILHEEMGKKFFFPIVTIQGDTSEYELPTGTYRNVGIGSVDIAANDAKEAGEKTIQRSSNAGSFSFFVVEYTNSRKQNLAILKK